jgi:hypothetical protein
MNQPSLQRHPGGFQQPNGWSSRDPFDFHDEVAKAKTKWIPACAGMTSKSNSRVTIHSDHGNDE